MGTKIPAVIIVAGAIISSKHLGDGHRYLLVKETRKDVKGLWSMPGGHLEPGETPIETAIRELREESGYHVKITDLAGIGVHTYKPGQKGLTSMVFSFYGRLTNPTPDPLDVNSETAEADWFSYEEIHDLAERSLLREPEPTLAALERAHNRDTNAEDYGENKLGKLIDVNDIFQEFSLPTVF